MLVHLQRLYLYNHFRASPLRPTGRRLPRFAIVSLSLRLAFVFVFALNAAARAENVLFIGDILTALKTAATNEDIPAVLAKLAAARSETVTFSEAIDLGDTLQTSWDAGIPEPLLTGSTKFDFIVYQEFSTLPTSNKAVFDSTATQT